MSASMSASAHKDVGNDAAEVQGATHGRSPSPTYDCDSEELEMLEEAAHAELESDDEVQGVIDEAAALYPADKVQQLMDELKSDGLVAFVRRHVLDQSRAQISALLVAFDVLLPRSMRMSEETPLDVLVAILKTALVRHLRLRDKLPQYNTVDDAVALLQKSRRIVVLGGAGLSTSCGIPDFRSPDGIYAQLQRTNKYPELTDPTDMFHKDFFLHDPTCFFSFAKDIFPSNFTPSPSHRFIKLLEERGQLLRHYTQNIDTLEDAAGIQRVLHCHGSFSRAKCTLPSCGYEIPGSEIKEDIMAQRVPQCPQCRARLEAERVARAKPKGGKKRRASFDDDDDDDDAQDHLPGLSVMKPCITFFGEKLSGDFDRAILSDRDEVDLLVIMGTTLKVAPVSEIVAHFPHTTPIILINRTPVLHYNLDIQLLGNADGIVSYLCRRLGWTLPLPVPKQDVVGTESAAAEVTSASAVPCADEEAIAPTRLADSHFWVFEGAEVPDRVRNALNGVEDEEEDEDDGNDTNEDSLDEDGSRLTSGPDVGRLEGASTLRNGEQDSPSVQASTESIPERGRETEEKEPSSKRSRLD